MSQELTQAEADRLYGAEGTPLWVAAHPDGPTVTLHAVNAGEAAARYRGLCGVTASPWPATVHAAQGPASALAGAGADYPAARAVDGLNSLAHLAEAPVEVIEVIEPESEPHAESKGKKHGKGR